MPSESLSPRVRGFARMPLVAVLAVLVAACSTGATPVPTPADATQLMSAMVASLSSVKQIDAHLTLAGTLSSPSDSSAATPDASATPASVSLDGTVVDLKSDMTAGSADLAVTLPADVGGGGNAEVIVVGQDVYLKLGPLGTLLGMADDGKYHHTTTATLGALGGLSGLAGSSTPAAAATASAAPSALAQALDQLHTFFAGLAQPPTITAVTCGSAMCWDLHVVLGPADLARLAAQGADALPSTIPFAGGAVGAAGALQGVTLDVVAQQSDSRPAEVKTTVDAGSAGTATADLTMTFDQPLTITAPPADQVLEGLPTFDLP